MSAHLSADRRVAFDLGHAGGKSDGSVDPDAVFLDDLAVQFDVAA